jgi:hypothetical protein
LSRRETIHRISGGIVWRRFATLARRSCEAAADSESYYASEVPWATNVSAGFDALQSQFLEIRSLAGGLGEDVRGPATRAFDAFIAAADRVNLLASPHVSMVGTQSKELQVKALESFREAADALLMIAPKTATERAIAPGYAKKIAEMRGWI